MCAAGVGGGESENNSGFALFEVEVTLTAAGLHAEPGLGLAAVAVLFQYLHMLKAARPQEWVWRESKLISDCKFRCEALRPAAADHGSAPPCGCRCVGVVATPAPSLLMPCAGPAALHGDAC